MKILTICRGSTKFLEPLITHWEKEGHQLVKTIPEADVIFCEWGNEQSIAITDRAIRNNIVIRVHGSEFFQNYHARWNKEKVFAVLKANPTYNIPDVNVIDCGIPIDTNFWSAAAVIRKQKRLIMVGSFVYSKNHVGLLHILSENPDYFEEIIFVGDLNAEENPYRYAETQKTLNQIEYYANKYNLPVFLKHKKTPEELRELYSTCGYVISNSINEGFHAIICEGILCGCQPLIYDWEGAEEIHGIRTYHNSSTFWKQVDIPLNQSELIANVVHKFNQKVIFNQIDDVLFDAAREWM